MDVYDAALIWASNGKDEDYSFGYSEDELESALRGLISERMHLNAEIHSIRDDITVREDGRLRYLIEAHQREIHHRPKSDLPHVFTVVWNTSGEATPLRVNESG